jgi:uncharacterized protein YbcI
MQRMANPPGPPETSEDVAAAPAARGTLLVELSNAVVGIHKQFYGKGPTKARSHLSHDLLTVVLEGGYTRGEQTLHDRGYDEQIVQTRLAMQASVEGELRAAVEAILGRQVRSFMSANDPSNEMQAEIFVLVPQDAHEPAEAVGEDDLPERAARARAEHREVLDEHRALRAEQVASREALRRSKPAH